jgi:hypothetical protein
VSGPVNVDQGDYVAVLEDELARERKARLVLTALLRSKDRALGAYVGKYGDITQPDPHEGGSDAAGTE